MRFIRRIGCMLGYHHRGKWNDDGITCVDCGFHKSKSEVIADLNAGGGW